MTDIAHIAAEVTSKLASSRVRGGSAFISTPLTYAGGATVVVRLDPVGSRFFVSDAGIGAREADMMGGSLVYARVARQFADRYGVRFDNEYLFEADATEIDLVAAVIAIANASKAAVEQTAYKLTEKAAQDAKILVKERLLSAFSKNEIEIDFVIRGASNDEWEFDAAVKRQRRISLFQVVTPTSQSVTSAVARFIDMADLPESDRPQLVGALQDRDKTPRIKLLSRTATIIDLSAESRIWQRVAA